jgi:hypothetical protein
MKFKALCGLTFCGLLTAGRPVSRVDTPLPGRHPVRSLPLAAGDLDGDGRADLVAGHNVVRLENDQRCGASALLSRGDGTFTSSLLPLFNAAARTLLLTDLDGDGRLDLVAAWREADGLGDVRVFMGLGKGAFSPGGVVASTLAPGSVAAGDLNADGRTDLVVIDGDPPRLLVYFGRGDGTFEREQVYRDIFARAVAIGDLDGDGRPEAALAVEDSVVVMRNDGKGALAPPVVYPGGKNVRALVMADLDSDGKRDIVTVEAGDGAVSVYPGRGDGTLLPRRSRPVGAAPEAVAVGDLNGDGSLDVATANAGDGSVTVLFGKGDGGFRQRAMQRAVGARPGQLVLADVTGDGRPEIVTGNRGDGTVTVLQVEEPAAGSAESE